MCPASPFTAWPPATGKQLRTLHERIVGGERDPALVESFPFEEMGARADWPWRAAATGLYANWMAGVTKRSS